MIISRAPLLSVVIPTYKRPHYLSRAIASALQAAPDGDVEVIVVPNGPDESWKTVAENFRVNVCIQWHPIEIGHANVARNYGMARALGKYIRFLDDDDYLFPEARAQIITLESNGDDICSGMVSSVDEDGRQDGLVTFPKTRDFVCAATMISGFTLPVGNLFRRSKLNGCQWDVQVNRTQDNVWMIDLAAAREWSWVHHDKPVGTWFQHRSTRISTVTAFSALTQPTVLRLLKLFDALSSQGRLDDARKMAIAAGLWNYAHRGFPYHPVYWSKVARNALRIHPESRPNVATYQTGSLSHINPVVAEWLIYPARKLTRSWRDLLATIHGADYRRRL